MHFLHYIVPPGSRWMWLCLLLIVSRCGAQKKPVAPHSRYDLAHPQQTINLPGSINQISGISYSSNSVYAIDDDHGDVYKIPLTDKPDVAKWKVGKPQDYEDVVLFKNTIYILGSKGRILYFPSSFPVATVGESDLDIKGKNEFETLYYDPHVNRLIMLCKDCRNDKKDQNTAYAFNPDTHIFEQQPAYVLLRTDIEKALGKSISRFKPSAAAVHPITGETYVVSSVNKLIVVLDKDRKVIAAYPLDEDLFKQPEGITFTPKGDMIISNEYAHTGTADLLIFKMKQ